MSRPHAPPPPPPPLFRLLAVNLAIGICAAVLMLGGLFALNPGGLRDLVLADRDGGVAVALLLFGLVITFGSVAMGTAIMALGDGGPGGGKGWRRAVVARLARARLRAR